MHVHRELSWSMRVAAIILVATALLKLLDSLVRHEYFEYSDSLFYFLSHRQVMLVASGLEIGIATFIWISAPIRQSIALFWFCCIVGSYKIAMHFTYDTKPCSCLGVLGRTFGLSNNQLEQLTWLLLGGMVLISLYTCSREVLRKRRC